MFNKIFLSIFFSILLFSCPCSAQYADYTILIKTTELLKSTVTVVLVMGGFGLVGLAVGAIFGTVKWKWFACLAFGLVVVSMALSVVAYFTGSEEIDQFAANYDKNWEPMDKVNVSN